MLVVMAVVVLIVLLIFSVLERKPLSTRSPALRFIWFVAIIIAVLYFIGGRH